MIDDQDDRRRNRRLVEWSGRVVVALGVAAVLLLVVMWLATRMRG